MTETVQVVIAGHVDHGKSTLIGRLLFDTDSLSESIVADIIQASEEQGKEIEFAFVMDHLAEERSRAVTIDAAHTFFQSDVRRYALIDAPGHVEFLKNMITGATQADAGILVIDAAQGVADQTRRHAYLLKMLGIRQVLLVINKMDLIGYKKQAYADCREAAQTFLASIGAGAVDCIPISAREGQNIVAQDRMAWYTGPSLLEALDRIPVRDAAAQDLRLPIQMAYRHDGQPVAFGKVASGRLEVNHPYTLFPGSRSVKILRLLTFEGGQVRDSRTTAEKGESVSLLADTEMIRGDVLLVPGDETITDRLEARIFWMNGRSPGKPGDRFTLKLTTQQVACSLAAIRTKLDPSNLTPEENPEAIVLKEVGQVELVLDQPVLTDHFYNYPGTGRFVLEAGGRQVAGGIIK